MAQNFKSKDLTISIPEKGAGEPLGTGCNCNTNIQQTKFGTVYPTPTACGCTHITNPCLGFTYCGFVTPIQCHVHTLCHGYSPIISPGTCTTTVPHCTPTPCTLTDTPPWTPEQEISELVDPDTLTALKEKLTAALKEVEAQQASLSKK